MEGARYLEDGRLTIFKRSGVFPASALHRRNISGVRSKLLMKLLRSVPGENCSIRSKSESRSAFQQNQNYFMLSLMTTFDFVSGIMHTARHRMEC
jgi:hypothetical protein